VTAGVGGGMDDLLTPGIPSVGISGRTTAGGTPMVFATMNPAAGGFKMPDMFGPGGVGFDIDQFSGIGNYATSFGLPSGNVMDPLGFVGPTETQTKEKQKDERSWREKRIAGENPFLDRLKNIKDPAKRRAWAKRFFGNILRMHPATRTMMMAIDLGKAIKQGGGQGILGALGQTAMQRLFGKNLDVARGIFGAASGQMTPGQALGGVAMNRGMRIGVNNLMKNIYKQYGMSGVKAAMPIVKTLMQGPGKG
jgi:hypothetical protein